MADQQVDRTLTYEQLEWRVKQRELDLEKAGEALRAEKEETRKLRLILRGMVDEHFTLRVDIHPEVFAQSKDVWDAVQMMLRQYCKRTAYAIEETLGHPLRRLQEALMHIHYLENHATNRGLPFTPFERRASDAWLYY